MITSRWTWGSLSLFVALQAPMASASGRVSTAREFRKESLFRPVNEGQVSVEGVQQLASKPGARAATREMVTLHLGMRQQDVPSHVAEAALAIISQPATQPQRQLILAAQSYGVAPLAAPEGARAVDVAPAAAQVEEIGEVVHRNLPCEPTRLRLRLQGVGVVFAHPAAGPEVALAVVEGSGIPRWTEELPRPAGSTLSVRTLSGQSPRVVVTSVDRSQRNPFAASGVELTSGNTGALVPTAYRAR